MRKDNKTKEDAVSPVIGVMLMLVVTVVIAAVVVVFSTGLAGSTSTTPSALLDVEYIQLSDLSGKEDQMGIETGFGTGVFDFSSYSSNFLANFGIKHKGGDAIPLKNIMITLEQVGGSAGNDGVIIPIQAVNNMVVCNPTYEQLKNELINGQFNFGMTFPLMVLGKGDVDNYDVTTGVNLETGDVLRVAYWDGVDSMAWIKSGAIIKWTVSYIPTNGIIAKGEFEVP